MPNDERIRLKRLKRVVEIAWSVVTQKGTSAKTLKIFMAPEFYFRPFGSSRPQSTYSESAALNIIEALKKTFNHKDYRDWLIVPGTILWSMPMPWEEAAQSKLDEIEYDEENPPEVQKIKSMKTESFWPTDQYAFFNTVALIKGGTDAKVAEPIHKRSFSSDDNIDQNMEAARHPFLRELLGKDDVRALNVQKIDSIEYAIEICKDHGVVREERTADWKAGKLDSRFVDLQLLTACGKGVLPKARIARPDQGFLLRVDGKPYPPIKTEGKSYQSTLLPIKASTWDEGPNNQDSSYAKVMEDQLTSAWVREIKNSAYLVTGSEHAKEVNFVQRLIGYPVQSLREFA